MSSEAPHGLWGLWQTWTETTSLWRVACQGILCLGLLHCNINPTVNIRQTVYSSGPAYFQSLLLPILSHLRHLWFIQYLSSIRALDACSKMLVSAAGIPAFPGQKPEPPSLFKLHNTEEGSTALHWLKAMLQTGKYQRQIISVTGSHELQSSHQ